MWIYVPVDDEAQKLEAAESPNEGKGPAAESPKAAKEPWVGIISPPDQSGASWTFELIRHADLKDAYDTKPLDHTDWKDAHDTKPLASPATVRALLDYQRRCTLFRPLVLDIDPGKVGTEFLAQRTRIAGEFQALLSGLAVEDAEAPSFNKIRFDSEVFAVWYGGRAFSTDFNPATRSTSVDIKEPTATEFSLTRGIVTCTASAQVSAGVQVGTIRSVAIFSLALTSPISFRETVEMCFGLERLFGFLIGHQAKPPVFEVAINKTYEIEGHVFPCQGTLEIGGAKWKTGDVPHPMKCVHLRGQGDGTLDLILNRFFAKQGDISSRIFAIDFCRHFSSNLSDRFSVIMPVLDEYLKARYMQPEEIDYLKHEEAFFHWIKQSPDPFVDLFSKKHIQTKDSKKPGLKTLLTRAIDFVNGKGFVVPPEMAERIPSRRGSLFHNSAKMDEADVWKFQAEIRAATALLMLHTFDDLGIDIAILAKNGYGVADLREFVLPPKRTVPDGAASMTVAEYAEAGQVNQSAKSKP